MRVTNMSGKRYFSRTKVQLVVHKKIIVGCVYKAPNVDSLHPLLKI